MAQNRMFIRCMNCGEKHYIATRLFEFHTDASIIEPLNKFFKDHYYCNKNGVQNYAPECFELDYDYNPNTEPFTDEEN